MVKSVISYSYFDPFPFCPDPRGARNGSPSAICRQATAARGDGRRLHPLSLRLAGLQTGESVISWVYWPGNWAVCVCVSGGGGLSRKWSLEAFKIDWYLCLCKLINIYFIIYVTFKPIVFHCVHTSILHLTVLNISTKSDEVVESEVVSEERTDGRTSSGGSVCSVAVDDFKGSWLSGCGGWIKRKNEVWEES